MKAPAPDEVLRLAASGVDVSALAVQLGVTPARATKLLERAIAQAASRGLDRDGSREVERRHLEMVRRAMTPIALRGDVAAARVLVRIHEAMASLLGLADEPAPVAPPAPEKEVTQLDQLRSRRAARIAAASGS